MTHLSVTLVILFDDQLKSYQGLPIDSRILDYSTPEMIKKQGSGFAIGVLGSPEGLVSPARFANIIAPGWGRSHSEYMKKYYGAHSAVSATAHHTPKRENSVRLSQMKDDDGMPKAKVSVNMQDDDLQILRLMLKRCNEVAEASGTKTIGIFTSLDSKGSVHVAGTARMGNRSQNSVVNSFGQSHDIENLFIADSSVLVTQGYGDSPSLTIIALALRSADYIASLLKRGNL
jgi:choline dehydrogenase-like flavoprotein